MTFEALNLNPMIIKAIEASQYKQPTPIQEKAIPLIMAGKDLLASAQTGTGKTAAFAIPILEALAKSPLDSDAYHPVRALILAPTRELALQIGESFETYGQCLDLTVGVIYGGITPKRHIKVMKREPDILVATPGRLLDLFGRGSADLNHVKTLVIDEADRMLDLGMIQDVKSIIAKLPKQRQNLLFSATMPKAMNDFTKSLLKNPIKIAVKSKAQSKIQTKQCLYYVEEPDKTALILDLLKDPSLESVLIFVRTKKKADKLAKAINVNNIRAKALHGDKSQSERIKSLELFKNKEARVLVATDVAARGIDIDKLSHVINMDIPKVPESYIHRCGRTGRAGQGGTTISLCSNQEIPSLKAIEALQGKSLKVIKGHPYVPLNIAIKENRNKYKDQK